MINKAKKLSTKIRRMVNSFFPIRSIKEAIKQKHCYLCDMTVYGEKPICEACHIDLPFNVSSCANCAIPLPLLTVNNVENDSIDRVCGECLKVKPSYSQCFSTFSYTFPVNALISDFKYHNKRHLGKLLSSITAETIKAQIENNKLRTPDKLIPVPLHIDKLDSRGFNQSEDICKDLSRYLNIPIDATCIRRTQSNPAQASLTKKQRQQNLAQSFQTQTIIEGEVVALVDDVITTGVTAKLLSKLLLQAGAKEVYVWSLARTPLNS